MKWLPSNLYLVGIFFIINVVLSWNQVHLPLIVHKMWMPSCVYISLLPYKRMTNFGACAENSPARRGQTASHCGRGLKLINCAADLGLHQIPTPTFHLDTVAIQTDFLYGPKCWYPKGLHIILFTLVKSPSRSFQGIKPVWGDFSSQTEAIFTVYSFATSSLKVLSCCEQLEKSQVTTFGSCKLWIEIDNTSSLNDSTNQRYCR